MIKDGELRELKSRCEGCGDKATKIVDGEPLCKKCEDNQVKLTKPAAAEELEKARE